MSDDGFEVVETITKLNKPPMATVSYMKGKKLKDGKRDDRKPRLQVWLPSKVMTAQSKNFMLMRSKDKTVRKLRIVGQNAANKNTVPCTSMKHAIRFDFGFVPWLGDEMAAAEECALTVISRESYEIEMPKWFKPERK